MKYKIIYLTLFIAASLGSIAQTKKVTVELHSVVGYGTHEDFAKRAAIALDSVLNSEEFKNRMLALKFRKTNDMTNQQLYETIMKAHEVQGKGGNDGVVDLYARTLRIDGDESKWKDNCEIGSHSGTIGIDGNGDGVTAICPQRLEIWVKENNVSDLAGHYAHEYMHILGFNHSWMFTQKNREKTFVYMIGDFVAELVEKNMKNEN